MCALYNVLTVMTNKLTVASDDEEDQTVLALRGIEDTSSDDGSDLETAIRSDSGWGNKKSTLYGADNTELEVGDIILNALL